MLCLLNALSTSRCLSPIDSNYRLFYLIFQVEFFPSLNFYSIYRVKTIMCTHPLLTHYLCLKAGSTCNLYSFFPKNPHKLTGSCDAQELLIEFLLNECIIQSVIYLIRVCQELLCRPICCKTFYHVCLGCFPIFSFSSLLQTFVLFFLHFKDPQPTFCIILPKCLLQSHHPLFYNIEWHV